MNIEMRRVKFSSLIPAGYNPRKISDEEKAKLQKSIEKFGYVEPIVWNEKSGNIVGGHQRYAIMKQELKPDDMIDVSVVNLDEPAEKALNLALNKISGQWDNDKLAQLLRELDAGMISVSGFDDDEVTQLLAQEGIGAGPVESLVITVEPPEAPQLKERASFYFENKEDYDVAKEFFKKEGTHLSVEKLKKLMQ